MRSLFLIIFLIFLQQTLTAELAAKEGYYVTMQDDTIHGIIKVRIDYLDELYYFRIQYGAFFEDSLGNLTILKPDNVKSFSFYHKYQHVKFVSLKYDMDYRIFLHAINEEGAVKLYSHYRNVIDTRTSYGSLAYYLLAFPASSEVDKFFMVKSDGSTLRYGKFSGKKKVSLFFSDCPQLHAKIERGLYGYTAVYRMVREYNQWAAMNKK